MLVCTHLRKNKKLIASTLSLVSLRHARTLPFKTFTLQLNYKFVNIKIDSKFYHAQLPITVPPILEMTEKQSILNEKLVLLEHLSDILESNKGIILSMDQRARIIRQLKLWQGGRDRFDKVATVAWLIVRFGLMKELEYLYTEIAYRFQNDQWYVNFDQSLKALEAFAHLKNEQLKEFIYPRIQRNIEITVWEENMKTYQRLVVGLLESGRVESPLWDKLQDFILRNLGMDYSLKTITDIFISYALARKGSDRFFQMIQKAISLGHWYNYELKHKILPGYDQTGQFYALLVQTYSIVKRNCDIYLMPALLQYIYLGVADRKTNYQHLSSFTKLINHLHGLFEPEDEEEIITNLLQNKKPTSITYAEIIQFYGTLRANELPLPKQLHKHIESVLFSDIRKKLIPASKVLQIYEELLQNDYVLNKADLLDAVQTVTTSGLKYLEGEQAKAVLQLSAASRFLPQKTKQILRLPGKGAESQ